MPPRDEPVGADLFEYGIHTEQSDVRAHVSVVNRRIYVFPTKNGIAAVEKFKPPLADASQNGITGRTAEGWKCKVEWIDDIRRCNFQSWGRWDEFKPTLTTTQKGALAVRCVVDAMRLGRFPFWLDATEDDRETVQLKGTDILVFCKKRVQVKCDWSCGEKPAGTGNVFLQRAERNPRRAR